jgi:hypothetical protein
MLRGFNDFDVFEPRRLHLVRDKLCRFQDIVLVFGQRADTGNAKKCLQLIQQAYFVICYKLFDRRHILSSTFPIIGSGGFRNLLNGDSTFRTSAPKIPVEVPPAMATAADDIHAGHIENILLDDSSSESAWIDMVAAGE